MPPPKRFPDFPPIMSHVYKHKKHMHSTLVLDSSVIFLPEKANFELLSSFRHLYFVYIADLELEMFRS